MGTEVRLGLAMQSQNATLSVKIRLACKQPSFFIKVVSNMILGCARACRLVYYYHGLILDKGTEPSSHVSVVCCFLAAEDLLAESKKACLTFCLSHPITRAAPSWGAMKHFHKKIPNMASKKSQMCGYLLDQEK
ncbi:Endosomal targeting BRO1-like domain-containing protein [Striga hermonthica]|uniref:Endosomal targeting BRO1-like domain-containing protein n=1 Tax=Striga hermonthica TaxID=68872 RepID=A0A9N7N806_STRHE|nr:Endosomal targeting BRO1-like domain-containing protein [Striga hermonthica]